MTDPRPDEATKLQAIIDAATAPDEDTEDKLLRLEAMMEARREDPVLKAKYEALRDELARDLRENGPRYLIGVDGTKEYAHAVTPENIVTDIGELEAMVKDGELDKEVFEKVAPRKVDPEALRQAIARGSNPRARKPGIRPDQVVRAVRIVKGTSYVRFVRPDDSD